MIMMTMMYSFVSQISFYRGFKDFYLIKLLTRFIWIPGYFL